MQRQRRGSPLSGKVLLGLLPLLLTLTSCIVTYQGFPQVDLDSNPIPYQNQNVSYVVEPSMSEGFWLFLRFNEIIFIPGWLSDGNYLGYFDKVTPSLSADSSLAEVFERTGAFPGSVVSRTDAGKGLHIRMSLSYKPAKPYDAPNYVINSHAFLCGLTLTLIPMPSAKEYLVNYAIYVDDERQPRQDYTYTFRKRTLGGILVLPFVWINVFTDYEENALRATFYQFLIDAERDGYLTRAEDK